VNETNSKSNNMSENEIFEFINGSKLVKLTCIIQFYYKIKYKKYLLLRL
jgi:hypothetical protein